jgi:hypothetical protein
MVACSAELFVVPRGRARLRWIKVVGSGLFVQGMVLPSLPSFSVPRFSREVRGRGG